MLVTNVSNIRYLTGVQASFGLLLIQKNRNKLFLDGRYLLAARSGAYSDIEITDIKKFPKEMQKLKKTGFETEHITVARLGRWKRKYKNTKFIQITGLIENMRRKKTPGELKSINKACRITKAILKKLPNILKSGISEIETVFRIQGMAIELGAEGMAFDPVVAFGQNTAHPHHHPGMNRLRRGDLVQIDIGARYQGYTSDFSRVYFTGKKTAEQKKVHTAVLAAKRKAESLVRPGVVNRKLDEAARAELKKFGYEKNFTHSLGHGLGLDIHEMPTLSKKAPLVRLVKNEVITIEPGVYLEGKFGMRIEDTIIVR